MSIQALQTPVNRGGIMARPFMPLEQEAVQGFAHEIARRAEFAKPADGLERTSNAGELEKAVAGAVDFIHQEFGDRAARTVMGIVLQSADERQLSEDQLGQGFVNALEFIDRTFGIAAGDRAMEFFNGELNRTLNGFYQNGKNESFLALEIDQASEELGQAMGQAVSQMMKKIQQHAVADESMLMDQAREDFEDEVSEEGLEETDGPALDENGLPIAANQARPDAPARAGKTPDEAAGERQAETQGAHRSGGRKRGRGRRSVRRKRLDSSNGYERSGLRPGAVLNKAV